MDNRIIAVSSPQTNKAVIERAAKYLGIATYFVLGVALATVKAHNNPVFVKTAGIFSVVLAMILCTFMVKHDMQRGINVQYRRGFVRVPMDPEAFPMEPLNSRSTTPSRTNTPPIASGSSQQTIPLLIPVDSRTGPPLAIDLTSHNIDPVDAVLFRCSEHTSIEDINKMPAQPKNVKLFTFNVDKIDWFVSEVNNFRNDVSLEGELFIPITEVNINEPNCSKQKIKLESVATLGNACKMQELKLGNKQLLEEAKTLAIHRVLPQTGNKNGLRAHFVYDEILKYGENGEPKIRDLRDMFKHAIFIAVTGGKHLFTGNTGEANAESFMLKTILSDDAHDMACAVLERDTLEEYLKIKNQLEEEEEVEVEEEQEDDNKKKGKGKQTSKKPKTKNKGKGKNKMTDKTPETGKDKKQSKMVTIACVFDHVSESNNSPSPYEVGPPQSRCPNGKSSNRGLCKYYNKNPLTYTKEDINWLDERLRKFPFIHHFLADEKQTF